MGALCNKMGLSGQAVTAPKSKVHLAECDGTSIPANAPSTACTCCLPRTSITLVHTQVLPVAA